MEQKKRTVKPDYYDTFQCIADQCTFTCCQEWKIAVDDKTEEKWKKYSNPDEKSKQLSESVIEKDGARVIELKQDKKCPYLNKDKLCKLVIAYGEEILSETCHTFPRQIHDFDTRTEYSLVACCPAVIDIWNKRDDILHIGDSELENNTEFLLRKQMINIVKNKKNSNEKNFLLLFYMLLDIYKDEKKMEQYRNLTILEPVSSQIDKMKFSIEDTFYERNELFLDMIENYRKESLYHEHLDKIAELADKISEECVKIEMEKEVKVFQKEIEKYEQLFRNFLSSEIFTNILIPGGDLESMIVMTQWMAMEYAVMIHAIFLYWYENGKKPLSYEKTRDYIILSARITGYDQEDIYEYLENSFEELIWDWGYLALIIGK